MLCCAKGIQLHRYVRLQIQRLKTTWHYIEEADGSKQKHLVQTHSYPSWSDEDNRILVDRVQKYRNEFGTVDWKAISSSFPECSPYTCRTRYATALRKVAGRGETKNSLVTDNYNEFSARARWTKMDDEMLMTLVEMNSTRWDVISKEMGKFSSLQCSNRYYYKTKTAKKRESKSGAQKSQVKQQERPKSRRKGKVKWIQSDNDKLRSLMIANGKADSGSLAQHFPSHAPITVYKKMRKILLGYSDTNNAQGKWTNIEHKALIRLASQHNCNWDKVSRDMSTSRSVDQCRSHYYMTCATPPATRKRWSRQELEQLKMLVKLYEEGKLVSHVFAKEMTDQEDAKVGRLLDALKKDEQQSLNDGDAVQVAKEKKSIAKLGLTKWRLIALAMTTRTAPQCYRQWHHLKFTDKQNQIETCTEPWTQEEDACLYELYQQTPEQYGWISKNLPHPRKVRTVRSRYKNYIHKYVTMLQQCRGAKWDPMLDQFAEVHMRCEIGAWHKKTLEGYRTQDPYPAPFELDLTGYEAWKKDNLLSKKRK